MAINKISELQDLEDMVANIIFDDETASMHQQMLPRITGGGRRVGAPYSYECTWCIKKGVPKDKRRFQKFKTYEKHFTTFHLGKRGVEMTLKMFRENVPRKDPRWYCERCERYYSLGNKYYHKSVCRQDEDESSEDNEKDNEVRLNESGLQYETNEDDSEDESYENDDENNSTEEESTSEDDDNGDGIDDLCEAQKCDNEEIGIKKGQETRTICKFFKPKAFNTWK